MAARLGVVPFKGAVSGEWFVAEVDESLSAMCKRLIIWSQSALLAAFDTREEALAYAHLVVRLCRQFPDKPMSEIRSRARQILAHG